ncbi:transcriptional enhancer factor TEF-1-like isoform X2 [Synchiropus splendidus]|uniref:transcriptional enhancer factor TEF-1-like isoform X2 n=1 Tax=Synchiropus splendidus TaxID=270530 RepID=UPI00237E5DED|nr:transcriptional enhancer factor TEF-1-like isoform X2 [Synchiropus splendidus]
MERGSWSGSESPGDDMDRLSDSGGDKTMDGDPEGVWSPDIEQSFQEALAIYPPCGRRKIILSDEGKMYGRNELIARYIKLRTGKTRTRKQVGLTHTHTDTRQEVTPAEGAGLHTTVVRGSRWPLIAMATDRRCSAPLQVSSHIQVLARRKSREFQSKLKEHSTKEKNLQSISSMSSAQMVPASALHSKLLPGIVRASFPGNTQLWQGMIPGEQSGSNTEDIKPFSLQTPGAATLSGYERPAAALGLREPAWRGRSIGTTKLRLLDFSSFLETQREQEAYHKHLFVHVSQSAAGYGDPPLECVDVRQIYDKFPEKKGGLKELFAKGPQDAFYLIKFWADLNYGAGEDPAAFYGVSSQYESSENMTITCSTKVCSFGKQVVEKVETEYARPESGRFVYRISRSPMCEYMVNFIHKLKHLPEKYMMNSVLENFTILLVVSDRETQETLLCMACVFEVSNSEHGAQHHIYRLVKE